MKKNLLFPVFALCIAGSASAQNIIKIDKATQYQKIDGFGAMAENLPGWGQFKDMDANYVNTFVDDLGCTIFRTAIDGSMETKNDNNDPNNLNLAGYSLGNAPGGCDGDYHIPLNYQTKNLKALKTKIEANGDKPLFFSTVFSPPAWMKYVGCVSGTDPVWNRLINPIDEAEKNGTNEVDKDQTDEFAEFCLAYVTILKNAGIDIMAMNIQNEPVFGQPFSSCVYTPKSYALTLGAVAAKLKEKGFTTKMMFTEDISDASRYLQFIRAILDNPAYAEYGNAGIAAIHSYAANAQTPESSDAAAWKNLDKISRYKNANRPFWQTETSGYPDSHEGGMSMATAIFTALKYGKANAWVFLGMTRPVRELGSEHESLVKVDGSKSDRYYAAKHFYRYIRPGAIHVNTIQTDNSVMSIAFQNDAKKTLTVVLINPDAAKEQTVKLEGVQASGMPTKFQRYLTTSSSNQKVADMGAINFGATITLPANSVTTLVGEGSQPELPTANEDIMTNDAAQQLVVYPNPSKGLLTIALPSSNFTMLNVLDVAGRTVYAQVVKSNGNSGESLDLSGLQKGVYILVAKGETTTLRKQIVIE